MINRLNKLKLIICSAAFFFVLFGELHAGEIKLAITYSDSLKSTVRTIRGIKSAIKRHYDNVVYDEYLFGSSAKKNAAVIQEIENGNPKLILCIGSVATKIVSRKITETPIIFSAVLNPETSGFVQSLQKPGGNVTGASLDIPPNIQFNYFKQVIPNIKNLGVLYSEETANLIPPAHALAGQAGLKLHTIKINSEKEIPKALDSLSKVCEGLWSVADFNIYSPRSTKFILLNTLRNGIPFMGYSGNLVESGALFGLDYDYKDIGRQAGKIAVEVLSGKSAGSIPVAVPGIIWFSYNAKTANHININIPEDLVAVAKEVY